MTEIAEKQKWKLNDTYVGVLVRDGSAWVCRQLAGVAVGGLRDIDPGWFTNAKLVRWQDGTPAVYCSGCDALAPMGTAEAMTDLDADRYVCPSCIEVRRLAAAPECGEKSCRCGRQDCPACMFPEGNVDDGWEACTREDALAADGEGRYRFREPREYERDGWTGWFPVDEVSGDFATMLYQYRRRVRPVSPVSAEQGKRLRPMMGDDGVEYDESCPKNPIIPAAHDRIVGRVRAVNDAFRIMFDDPRPQDSVGRLASEILTVFTVARILYRDGSPFAFAGYADREDEPADNLYDRSPCEYVSGETDQDGTLRPYAYAVWLPMDTEDTDHE